MIEISLEDIDRKKDYILMYQCIAGCKSLHFFEMIDGEILYWKLMGNTLWNPVGYKDDEQVRPFRYHLGEKGTIKVSPHKTKCIENLFDKVGSRLYRLNYDEFAIHCLCEII